MRFFSNKLSCRKSNIHSALLLSCALMVLADSAHADPIAQNVYIAVDGSDVATLTTILTETSGYTTSYTKIEDGTVVFNPASANSYTGITNINHGTLAVASANSLPNTLVTISNGSTLQTNAAVTLPNNIYIAGGATTNAQASSTFNGVIEDNGSDLTVRGVGPVYFNADNVLTGTLHVGDGSSTRTLHLIPSSIAGTPMLVKQGTVIYLTGTGTFAPASINNF